MMSRQYSKGKTGSFLAGAARSVLRIPTAKAQAAHSLCEWSNNTNTSPRRFAIIFTLLICVAVGFSQLEPTPQPQEPSNEYYTLDASL